MNNSYKDYIAATIIVGVGLLLATVWLDAILSAYAPPVV